MAGVQIAMTQPIRLYDAVIVENEYGTIEEITSTYVIVKLWDLRRLVVPLSYFIEKPFQNWTRERSSSLIGSVFLYVDYGAPVDLIREKLNEILKQSNKWDGDIASPAGHRSQGRHHGVALPVERACARPNFRPALRGAREAHRFSAKGAPRSTAPLAAAQLQGRATVPKTRSSGRQRAADRRPARKAMLQCMLFLRGACGYPAQEFISVAEDSK